SVFRWVWIVNYIPCGRSQTLPERMAQHGSFLAATNGKVTVLLLLMKRWRLLCQRAPSWCLLGRCITVVAQTGRKRRGWALKWVIPLAGCVRKKISISRSRQRLPANFLNNCRSLLATAWAVTRSDILVMCNIQEKH